MQKNEHNHPLQENQKAKYFFVLYTTKTSLLVTNKFNKNKVLKFCRYSNEINFIPSSDLNQYLDFTQPETFTKMNLVSIFGMIKIKNKMILLLITKAIKVAHFRNKPIYKIEEVKGKIISKNRDVSENPEEMLFIMDNIRKYLRKGFYFSHFYDLTTKFPFSLLVNKNTELSNFPRETQDLEYLPPQPNNNNLFNQKTTLSNVYIF